MAVIDKLPHVSEAPQRRNYRDYSVEIPAVMPRTEKERLFVTEFLRDLSAKHAAVRAGYAESTAGALMNKPEIKAAIARGLAERHARNGLSAERMSDLIGSLAFGDPRDLLREDGTFKLPTEMDYTTAQLIGGFKTRRYIELDEDGKKRPVEVQEVKLIDRTKVLDMAMRHLGAYNDKKTVLIEHSIAERMRKADARLRGVAVDAIEAEFEEITGEPLQLEDQSLDDLLS